MLFTLLIRTVKLIVKSIICSLPIFLIYLRTVSDFYILTISFALFIIIMCVDAYRFSFSFWKKQYYYLGQLLPLVIYAVIAGLTCLASSPFVFNRIFLPLRFAGCFGMTTLESIPVVSVGVIAIVTIFRAFRAKSGHMLHEIYFSESEDDAE